MATISVFEHTGVGDIITGYQSDAHKPRGGAADFKVGGTKQDSRAKQAKKLYPPLFQMWGVQASKYQYHLLSGCRINKQIWGYKQANISTGLLNILKFAVWLSC